MFYNIEVADSLPAPEGKVIARRPDLVVFQGRERSERERSDRDSRRAEPGEPSHRREGKSEFLCMLP